MSQIVTGTKLMDWTMTATKTLLSLTLEIQNITHRHIYAQIFTDKFQHGLNCDNLPNFFFAGDGVFFMRETLVFVMVLYKNKIMFKKLRRGIIKSCIHLSPPPTKSFCSTICLTEFSSKLVDTSSNQLAQLTYAYSIPI